MQLDKIKVVYVNGCSHMCGAEIEGPNVMVNDSQKEKSWTGQLVKKYFPNAKYINESIPGQCNEMISIVTQDSLNDLLLDYDPSEIYVIIGWTDFYRRTFHSEYKVDIFDKKYVFNKQMTVSGRVATRESDIPRLKELAVGLVAHTSQYQQHITFLNYYCNMTNFLDLHGIEYFMMHSINSISSELWDNIGFPGQSTMLYTPENVKKVTESYQWHKYWTNPYTLKEIDYYLHLKFEEFIDPTVDGRYHHYTEEGHTVWLEKIIEPWLKESLEWPI
jgi:hypothetical protein